ncbi:MAG: putative NAD(P)H nitroreductase MhqN [Nitrospinaceae bacterium]|nr:MAG: putative NAD(P)H nitroreductase MhqN [Nitrospinaceae bacterium]
MEFSELIDQRRSVKSYDPQKTITDAELKELFEEVILSPSSFNLQHWTFIAVRDPRVKKQLKEAAWGQQQVEDSSVAFLVCGKLDAFKDAPKIYKEAPKDIQERMLPMIQGFYDGKAQITRDEAIRSASLAAMTLMYSAKARGWDTGPMIGFDPDAVSKILKLTPNYIPVMLLVLGCQKDAPHPRSYRRPVSEVVRKESLDGPGLSEG